MKKVISMLLVISIMFSMVTTSLATTSPASCCENQANVDNNAEIALANRFTNMDNVSVKLEVKSGYIAHEVSFPTIAQLVQTTEVESIDSTIAAQGRENVQLLKEYISELNLTNQEKNSQIRLIEESVSDGYVDGYTIYTTNASNAAHTFYGTYSGRSFYERQSSNITVNFKKET